MEPLPHVSDGVPDAVPEAVLVVPPSVLVTHASCAAAGVAVSAVASAIAEPATRYFLIVILDFTPLLARMGFNSGAAIQSPTNPEVREAQTQQTVHPMRLGIRCNSQL